MGELQPADQQPAGTQQAQPQEVQNHAQQSAAPVEPGAGAEVTQPGDGGAEPLAAPAVPELSVAVVNYPGMGDTSRLAILLQPAAMSTTTPALLVQHARDKQCQVIVLLLDDVRECLASDLRGQQFGADSTHLGVGRVFLGRIAMPAHTVRRGGRATAHLPSTQRYVTVFVFVFHSPRSA